MSLEYFNKFTTDGLVALVDFKNPATFQVDSSTWKVKSFTGDPNVYMYENLSVSEGSLYLSDNSIGGVIVKNRDTMPKAGYTISIKCTPQPGKYIYNDNQSVMLYYTETNKLNMMLAPVLCRASGFYVSAIEIDTSNNLVLYELSSNHDYSLMYLTIDGSVITTKYEYSAGAVNTFFYSYTFGTSKWYNGYKYLTCNAGYVKFGDVVYNDKNFSVHTNSTYMPGYNGDLDIDPSGFMYRVASNAHYVKKIPLEGVITDTISFGTGSATSASTGVNSPRGIALGTNYVFVSDTGNHRIMVLNKNDLTYVTHFGSVGTGDDNFNSPDRIYYKNGYLYIADRNNYKIKVYDETTFNYVKSISLPYLPSFVAINSEGNYLAIADYTSNGYFSVIDLSTDNILFTNNVNNVVGGPGKYKSYGCWAIDSKNENIYSFDRNTYQIIIEPSTFTVLSTETMTSMPNYRDVVLEDNILYGTYVDYGGAQKYDTSTKTSLYISNTKGSAPGEWGSTYYFDVDSSFLYVPDYTNHRIQILNKSDLSFVSTYGQYGTSDNSTNFYRPYCVTIDNSIFYVCDYGNNKIKIYTDNLMTYYGNFSITSPKKITFDDTYLYIFSSYLTISKYLKTDNSLVLSKTYDYSGFFPNLSYSNGTYIANIFLQNDKLYIMSPYSLYIADANTLEIEFLFGPRHICNLLDTPVYDSLYIDMIIQEDSSSFKFYVNGLESETTYLNPSSVPYRFDNIDKIDLGYLRSMYSNGNKYEYIAYYNREKTFEEHKRDYRNIMLRP
jgi:hypothetical protein